jgi:hypothetical protein
MHSGAQKTERQQLDAAAAPLLLATWRTPALKRFSRSIR